MRNPTSNEMDILFNLFPNTTGLDVSVPFITYQFQTLPSKPWPLFIAGLPVNFTTDEICTTSKLGRAKPELTNMNLKNMNTDKGCEVAYSILECYEQVQKIDFIGYGPIVRVLVAGEIDLFSLPSHIGNVMCLYAPVAADDKLSGLAWRQKEPPPDKIDDTDYSPHLRPGILLTSGDGPNDLSTTAGVLVRRKTGSNEVFLTVASHGWPAGKTDVFHPSANSRRLGKKIVQLSGTDIALMRFDQTPNFVNETFTSQVTKALTVKVATKPLRVGDPLFLNSPFSGEIWGIHMGTQRTRLDGEGPFKWQRSMIGFMGQGFVEPMPGLCGSAWVTEDGELQGFFHFLQQDGTCYSSIAEYLEENGYEVA